jgi:radical SAM-linked protein
MEVPAVTAEGQMQKTFRFRVLYKKLEPVKYTSTLDLHKLWERLLRRARIPLAYSQGFNKQPKITQANPLPLGFTSEGEMIDIWLEEDLPPDTTLGRIRAFSPPGIEAAHVTPIDLKERSLPAQVVASEYIGFWLEEMNTGSLEQRVKELLEKSSVPMERRGKQYDLRPLIEDLSVSRVQRHPLALVMRLASRHGATGRPDEVVSALELDPYDFKFHRLRLILS